MKVKRRQTNYVISRLLSFRFQRTKDENLIMNCLLLCIIYSILFYKQFIKERGITLSLLVFFLLKIVNWSVIFLILVLHDVLLFRKKLSIGRNLHFMYTFVYIFSFTLLLENNQQNVK